MKRTLLTVLATGALLAAGGGVATAADAPPPKVTHGPCQYTETPDDPAARPVPLPPDPRHTPDRGKVGVAIPTTQGPLPLTLDRAKAPCTVQSFLHLARHRFYDHTTCHRLTAYPTLKVLQCGDPLGTGEGGPGYKYKDELPVDLPPAPTDPTGARKVYAPSRSSQITRSIQRRWNSSSASLIASFACCWRDVGVVMAVVSRRRQAVLLRIS